MTSFFRAGDVILIDFPGVLGIKHGTAVVVSSGRYGTRRLDLIVGPITSRTAAAVGPADCVLQDWAAAGLPGPSAFRSLLATIPPEANPKLVGRLTDADWKAVRACLRTAIAALETRPTGHD